MRNIETDNDSSAVWIENELLIHDVVKLHEIAVKHDSGNFVTEAESQMLAQNYEFLTQQRGISREQYFEIFTRCAELGDYTELGLLFNTEYLKYYTKKSEENPDDENAPYGIASANGRISGLEEMKKNGKNPLRNIGSLSLNNMSEFALEMRNRDLSILNVKDELTQAQEKIATINEIDPPTTLNGFAELPE